MATRVLDIELAAGLDESIELPGYDRALVLLRYQGRPMGTLSIALQSPTLGAADIVAGIEKDTELSRRLSQHVLKQWLMRRVPRPEESLPTWSVVICTRDRTQDVRNCLEALMQNLPEGGEVIVVDNAPSSDETRSLVSRYPVKYVREDRPGLNWARSRGARVARGEVVIFTDDDVIVDKGWVEAILQPFCDPRVAAVTGIVMPMELESRAQELFETYGGFGRGFQRRRFDYTVLAPAASGHVGAGANMAIRRELIDNLRLFDAELDCGTVARTGGDAYAFYQILVEGYQIVYEPLALVWHRHRREYQALRTTLVDYSVGGYAFLTRAWLLHKDWQAVAVAFSWFWHDHIHQLGRAVFRRPNRLPLDLVFAQIAGIPRGFLAHFRAYQRECSLAQEQGSERLPAEGDL